MGSKTKIEWTRSTWNPIRAMHKTAFTKDGRPKTGWHCEHVSDGCRNCYAESMNKRLGTGLPFKPGHCDDIDLYLDETMLLQPLKWRKARMIFVGSMTDLFADFVPDEWIHKMFAVMALCPQHTFQILTKRPERMRKYMSRGGADAMRFHIGVAAHFLTNTRSDFDARFLKDGPAAIAINYWPLPNVWLGVSCEDQATADARVPDLLATPAAVRFVSAEPLLGRIDFNCISREDPKPPRYRWNESALYGCVTPWATGQSWAELAGAMPRLDWIIVGGESGPGARPMHPDWVHSIRDQCADAGVPFFFKQWGDYLPVGQHLPGHGKISGATAVRPGRRKLHFAGPSKGEPKYAFAEKGVGAASTNDGRLTFRIGKKAAGRLLDGVEWNQMPEVRS
ncbi:MAG: phage Gp37/Gp68 family protein [Bradyrhizobium sp.]|nr:phage Gp37/Gp68 family protein [Bradyrhizobium sp.]